MPEKIEIVNYGEGTVAHYAKNTDSPAYADTVHRLEAVLLAERDINATLSEIEHLQDMRTRITSVLRECTSNGGAISDARAEATNRLVDAEKQLYAHISEYDRARFEAKSDIERLKSDKQRAVIYRKYILGWSWSRIADDLGMCKDAVFRLRKRALLNLSELHHDSA